MNCSDVVRGERLLAASVFALPRNPADRMTLEEVLSHPWIALNCTGSLALCLCSELQELSSCAFHQGENAIRLQQTYGGII